MGRIKIEKLTTIPINSLVYTGSWSRQFGHDLVSLQHEQDGIHLFVNGVRQHDYSWRIYERTIKGRLWRNGYIPADKAWEFYVIGEDNKRYKNLYLLITEQKIFIGTRKYFRATYARSNLSRRQRKIAKECRLLRLTKHKRERRLQLDALREAQR